MEVTRKLYSAIKTEGGRLELIKATLYNNRGEVAEHLTEDQFKNVSMQCLESDSVHIRPTYSIKWNGLQYAGIRIYDTD